MKRIPVYCAIFAAVCAAVSSARAEVIVTSVWKRVAVIVTNDVTTPHIKVQPGRIALGSRGYHPFPWHDTYRYRYSTNDGLSWAGPFVTPGTPRTGSFFLGEDGNPFLVTAGGTVGYSTNFGHTWLTNLYVTEDHSRAGCVAALDPGTTNLHLFYVATNRPPLDPVESTNIRYAVFAKKTAAPGWDAPATNTILGGWPATNDLWHGAAAFRDPLTGRFRSVRAHAPGNNVVGENPWLCVVTNNGGAVFNMNTEIARDGHAMSVAVGTNGAVYMAHVGMVTPYFIQSGSNLVFTEFRYDESAGLDVATNQVIALGEGDPYRRVANPCIGLGVNGEIIVAYLVPGAGYNNRGPCDVRIIARDRFGVWQEPVTVASGNSDLGMDFPGTGLVCCYGMQWASANLESMAMDVAWEGDKNCVYLFYGEYAASVSQIYGAMVKNAVVHKVLVYDPPPPRGTRVIFR